MRYIVTNGTSERHFLPGDRIIIIAAFALTDEPVQPKMMAVNAQNQFAVVLAVSAPPAFRHSRRVGGDKMRGSLSTTAAQR